MIQWYHHAAEADGIYYSNSLPENPDVWTLYCNESQVQSVQSIPKDFVHHPLRDRITAEQVANYLELGRSSYYKVVYCVEDNNFYIVEDSDENFN